MSFCFNLKMKPSSHTSSALDISRNTPRTSYHTLKDLHVKHEYNKLWASIALFEEKFYLSLPVIRKEAFNLFERDWGDGKGILWRNMSGENIFSKILINGRPFPELYIYDACATNLDYLFVN